MATIYAVVFHDTQNRGFERVANDAARVLELDGFAPLYQSNEIPLPLAAVSDPDFHVEVYYHGNGPLKSLSAFDETESAPATENEEMLAKVRLATPLLAWLNESLSWEDGCVVPGGDKVIAAADQISRVCDAWDELVNLVQPEEGTDGQ